MAGLWPSAYIWAMTNPIIARSRRAGEDAPQAVDAWADYCEPEDIRQRTQTPNECRIWVTPCVQQRLSICLARNAGRRGRGHQLLQRLNSLHPIHLRRWSRSRTFPSSLIEQNCDLTVHFARGQYVYYASSDPYGNDKSSDLSGAIPQPVGSLIVNKAQTHP